MTPATRLSTLLLVIASALASLPALAQAPTFEQRFFRYNGNFIFDETEAELKGYIDRAAAVGYTGVLVSDPKVNRWWFSSFRAGWQGRVASVRDYARSKGMTFVFSAFPVGYGGTLVEVDPSRASGYPVEDAPLRATDDRLLPVQTAALANGGFEDATNGRADGWDFQDVPGVTVDPTAGRDGGGALRVDAAATAEPNRHGRTLQRIDVRPHQQYRIRVWVRMEAYTARRILPLLLNDADGRNLGTLHFSVERASNPDRRDYFNSARDRTMGWTELAVTFNSLDATRVRFYLGTWGNESGTLWWDDVRLDAVPTYNTVRRPDLPVAVTSADGTTTYTEGVDYGRIEDPAVTGEEPYDASHPAPEIVRLPGSAIPVGAEVRYSGYHAALVQRGQIAVSWNAPVTADAARDVFRNAGGPDRPDLVGADGYLVNYDEVRSGGWEPADLAFGSSGAALAASIATTSGIMRAETGAAGYQWSDMFDPYHNAREDFYAIRGDLTGSWDGLDPDVTVFNWWSGSKLRSATAARSVAHFDSLGITQIIAGYYDEDVEDNRDAWFAAYEASGADGVAGAMYTTYENDWSNLEAFAEAWWGSEPPPTEEPEATAPLGQTVCLVADVNDRYVAAEARGRLPLIANRAWCLLWEQFDVVDAGDGAVAFRAKVNGRYVTPDASGVLAARADSVGPDARFAWEEADGAVCLRSESRDAYVAAEAAGQEPLVADRSQCREWETFRYEVVGKKLRPALAQVSATPLDLAVGPNPMRGRGEVAFSLPEAGPARVDVVDLLGRTVAVLADGEHGAGVHAAPLDVAGWAAGVYVVRLRTGAESRVVRVTVVR